MKQIFIKQINKVIGKKVLLKGWIFNKRSSGSIVFLQIRDGTGVIQATVLKEKVSTEVFKIAQELTLESSVIITGVVKKDERSPTGFELDLQNIKIVRLAHKDYPIGKKKHGPDFLLNNRHLWIRSGQQWAILKIRSKIFEEIENFYKKEGFTRVDTPILTPNSCEGTTTLFEVDYFGDKAYLSQSGQLYLEAAIASFGKVYDFSPVFRAEKSKTRRHLIEFWMTNAEVAFCDLDEIMNIQERLIMHVVTSLINDHKDLLKIIGRDTRLLDKFSTPFKRITYNEALKILHGLGSDIKKGEDFGNDDETMLMEHFKKPVFITSYPADVKAFYMKSDPNDPEKVLCCDLLMPEGYGEVIGGGERENDYNRLLRSVKKHNLQIKEYKWYLDLRKYGSVQHCGFGLGLERFLAWICKLPHVRESIPFPRLLGRLRP